MKVDTELFKKEVYEIVRTIPNGKVLTYGEIALLAGCPNHSRLVGRVMKGASSALGLPCHRVVNSQGRMAPGWEEQRKLLEGEGVKFKANGCVDMSVSHWNVYSQDNLASFMLF